MTKRSALIVSFLALSAAAGVLQGYIVHRNQDVRVVTTAYIFPAAILLYSWCKADAAQRGIPPPPGAPILVGLFALIGVPYYFFKILPPRRAAVSIAKALGVLLLAFAAQLIFAVAVTYTYAI